MTLGEHLGKKWLYSSWWKTCGPPDKALRLVQRDPIGGLCFWVKASHLWHPKACNNNRLLTFPQFTSALWMKHLVFRRGLFMSFPKWGESLLWLKRFRSCTVVTWWLLTSFSKWRLANILAKRSCSLHGRLVVHQTRLEASAAWSNRWPLFQSESLPSLTSQSLQQ